tara:strand:+ start:22 stop:606 length:585 start_codon:yes stop_codon:yes gene_type:complete
MAWAKNGTPTTLGSAADDIDITDLGGNKFNMILMHIIRSGNAMIQQTFNNDTGTKYTVRESTNGAGDVTTTSQTFIDTQYQQGYDDFTFMYTCWISGEEKLIIHQYVQGGATGASNAPSRRESVAKYAPASLTDTCDRIDCNNASGTGDYAADSNLSALGSEGVESMTVQDGAVYYDTDLNKSYVLNGSTWTEL